MNCMTFLPNILFGIEIYKEKILAFEHFCGFYEPTNLSSMCGYIVAKIIILR